MSSENARRKIDKAYTHIREANPNVTDKHIIELLTREYIIFKKNLISAILFFGGIFLFFLAIFLNPDLDADAKGSGFISVIMFMGIVSQLIGILKFCKDLHSPLTPAESKELDDYDAVEKGGRTDIDLSIYDDSAYIEYKKEKYAEATPLRKFLILIGRIPLFIKLLILMSVIFGIYSTCTGINNIMTYEERNKNAVPVEAYIVSVQEEEDSNDDTVFNYTYEYKYNGQAYYFNDNNNHTEYPIGHKKGVLIDSANPGTLIENNGKTNLILGLCFLAAGIALFIFSLLKVRDLESVYSIFSLFWLIFAAAAAGFAVWGIAMLIGGNLLGLLPLMAGCPMWILGALLFRKFFN